MASRRRASGSAARNFGDSAATFMPPVAAKAEARDGALSLRAPFVSQLCRDPFPPQAGEELMARKLTRQEAGFSRSKSFAAGLCACFEEAGAGAPGAAGGSNAGFDQQETADQGFAGANPAELDFGVFEGERAAGGEVLGFKADVKEFADVVAYAPPERERGVALIGREAWVGHLPASMRGAGGGGG